MNNCMQNINYKIILVDDNSSDDTANVCASLPNVHVIQTVGYLFWARSMIFGLEYINKQYPSYGNLLIFNDDINLSEKSATDFLKEAIYTSNILVAPFHDGSENKTYGGVVRDSRFNKLSFKQAPIGHNLCDTMNANLVSIPKDVIKEIGFFKSYLHMAVQIMSTA